MEYIHLLRRVNDKATELVRKYLETHSIPQTSEEMDALIGYSYAVATKYGEAAATAAAEMYDALAAASGTILEPAVPAATPEISEVAKAVVGTSKTDNEEIISAAIGRLVKQTGVDTTIYNALRDGAEWAWIPSGDTCAFCLTLASRGWQRASKKALRNGHAEHIHANCDCTYAVRFNEDTNVEGYDPEELYAAYEASDPGGKPKDKINALRRRLYDENKDKFNAQKRERYAMLHQAVLKKQLGFSYNNEISFIPTNTIITNTKTIAGKGSKTDLRVANELAMRYNNSPEKWSKKVGKITSDKYIFDIHWYEYDGEMYEEKIKFMKEKGK